MLKNMINNAKEKITKKNLENIQQSVTNSIQSAKTNTNTIANSYWPKIEKLLIEQLIPIAENSLKDEETLKNVFSTTYELLPTPVRVVLPRDSFINFCLERKEPILKKLSDYKKSKKEKATEVDIPKKENITNNINIYDELLPELIALCIVADGTVESKEIQLATEIIMNDEILTDKEKALNNLSNHIGSLIIHKNTSQTIYKIKSMDIFSKISKITNQNEKERIYIIVEGLLEVVNFETKTKEVTDEILKNIK